LALLVVDHLGLLADVLRGNDAVRDLGHVTKRLRDLAQKVDVSVLALSQLNRGVEQRASKRPHLHDLRASGELEQDADLVVLVYRDSYYYPAGTPIDADTGEVARGTSRHVYRVDPHLAELIVAANRDGPPGSALIHFNPTTMTIADISSGPDNHPILR
jgi:replicative DNA helicase